MDIQSFMARLASNPEWTPRSYEGVEVKARSEELEGVKAVLFDVYGTLIDYYEPTYSSPQGKQAHLLECFQNVVDEFSLGDALFSVQPGTAQAQTLRDFYHGLIMLDHERKAAQGVCYPEIRIEQIWKTIFQIVQRHGYEIPQPGWQDAEEMALAAAYLYHFHALGRRLYPGVYDLLECLRKKRILMGIISNAQFYSLFDLSWLLIRQSQHRIKDISAYFPEDRCILSYQYGVAKPNPELFLTAATALKREGVEPAEILYVGNDLLNDIYGASQAGFRTCLFCGDKDTLNLAADREEVKSMAPDLSIESLPELFMKLS